LTENKIEMFQNKDGQRGYTKGDCSNICMRDSCTDGGRSNYRCYVDREVTLMEVAVMSIWGIVTPMEVAATMGKRYKMD
jgi:hypothetical protein